MKEHRFAPEFGKAGAIPALPFDSNRRIAQAIQTTEIDMNNEHPTEGQIVQVKIGGGAWQSATYRRGQFVDLYGLTLDRQKISEWQPAGSNEAAIGAAAANLRESSLLH